MALGRPARWGPGRGRGCRRSRSACSGQPRASAIGLGMAMTSGVSMNGSRRRRQVGLALRRAASGSGWRPTRWTPATTPPAGARSTSSFGQPSASSCMPAPDDLLLHADERAPALARRRRSRLKLRGQVGEQRRSSRATRPCRRRCSPPGSSSSAAVVAARRRRRRTRRRAPGREQDASSESAAAGHRISSAGSQGSEQPGDGQAVASAAGRGGVDSGARVVARRPASRASASAPAAAVDEVRQPATVVAAGDRCQHDVGGGHGPG